MGFRAFMHKVFSGRPEVAGGDPEAEAILREEYGAGDPDLPQERPTRLSAGPVGAGGAEAFVPGAEAGAAADDAIEATDAPSDPAP
jgi:hypothetical protein